MNASQSERRSLRQWPRRLPFTITMVAVLTATAFLTDTVGSELARRVLRTWGWAPADFAVTELYRLLSSALITHGGSTLWLALGIVAVMVGWAEWSHGSKRSALTFWLGHGATLVVMTALASIISGDAPTGGPLWSGVRDVGPSAGAFACLGLASSALTGPVRRWLAVSLVTVLVVDLVAFQGAGPVETSADLAHAIAYLLGFASSLLGRRT